MKTKYQFDIVFTGFEKKPIKHSGIVNSLPDLRERMVMYKYSPKFEAKGTSEFKAFFEKFEQDRNLEKVLNLKETLTKNKKTIKVTTKTLQFDDSYEDTSLVEGFHTALRKYCDSKASWGLWQNINYSCDINHTIGLEVFWSNLAYTWRLVMKTHSHKEILKMPHEELTKLAKKFKSTHLNEMKEDPRVNHEFLKDNPNRALWYMLLGLYEGLPEAELGSCLYMLAECEVK